MAVQTMGGYKKNQTYKKPTQHQQQQQKITAALQWQSLSIVNFCRNSTLCRAVMACQLMGSSGRAELKIQKLNLLLQTGWLSHTSSQTCSEQHNAWFYLGRPQYMTLFMNISAWICQIGLTNARKTNKRKKPSHYSSLLHCIIKVCILL